MRQILSIAIILLGLAALASSQLASVEKCGEEEALKMDICSAKPVIVAKGSNQRYPSDTATATAYCNESKASVACMKSFARKCLTSLPRRALYVFANGVKRQLKISCKSNATKAELGKNLSCNNKVIAPLEDSVAALVDRLRRVPSMDKSVRKAAACCAMYTFVGDLTIHTKSVCTEDEIIYRDSFVSNFAGEMFKLVCAETAPGSDVCLNMKYPDVALTGPRPTSFLLPLLAAIQNL